MAKSKHAKQIARNKRRASNALLPPIAPIPDADDEDFDFDLLDTDDLQEEEDFDMQTVFKGQGTEDLTEDLITQLVAQGFPEKDLREMKAKGFKYSRPRNSFVSPPERI
jgi:hypothetical protein